jgi:hypothetical protein
MNVQLEVLHIADCPNLAHLLERLRQVTDRPVTAREIATQAEAVAAGMVGSPTLLIVGTDPFTTPGKSVPAVACRIYRNEQDQPSPAPSVAQLRVAVTAAGVAATSMQSATAPESPADVLGAWRARAVPVDPVEKAVHQLILRTFASSGRAPTVTELVAVSDGSGRASAKVLEALHELDAIREVRDVAAAGGGQDRLAGTTESGGLQSRS